MRIFSFLKSYLYFQGVTLKYLFKDLANPTGDMMPCYQKAVDHLSVTFQQTGDSSPISGENCIFLCNHRTAADFFIDGYLTGGAAYLGLAKAFAYFPGPCLYAYRTKSLILFSRRGLDRKRLYKKTLKMLKRRSVIIYPEGSRNLADTSKPLKKGFIKFAYDHGIPVQVVMTRDKESVFSERNVEVKKGVQLLTSRSRVLKPADYTSLDSWISAVTLAWDGQWNKVMLNGEATSVDTKMPVGLT